MNWLKEILETNKEKSTDEIIEAAKKTLPDHFIPKADFNAKNERVKTLQDDIKKRDNDLADLRKSAEGNAALQKQLDDLKVTYDNEKSDYETKLKDLEWSSNAKVELAGKVHDVDLVLGLLDKEKPVAEQLGDLQKSRSFLFVQNDQTKVSGVTPADGVQTPPPNNEGESIGARLGKQQTETKQTENPYFK